MIPKIIHFVYLQDKLNSETAYPFTLINYICLKSAIKHNPDYQYILWTNIPLAELLKNEWLYKLMNEDGLQPQIIEAPTEVFGNPITYVQHQADVVRILALKEHGGFYAESDMLIVKPFEDWLDKEFVIGKTNKKRIAIGLIGASIDNPIIKEWYDGYDDFSGGKYRGHKYYQSLERGSAEKEEQLQYWIYNSITKLNEILSRHPEASILEKPAMYFPANHFSEFRPFMNTEMDLPEAYAHHLWLSTKPELLKLTLEKLQEKDGYFYIQARKVLEIEKRGLEN